MQREQGHVPLGMLINRLRGRARRGVEAVIPFGG